MLTVLWVELSCYLVEGVTAFLRLDWLLSSVLHSPCLAAVVVGSMLVLPSLTISILSWPPGDLTWLKHWLFKSINLFNNLLWP